jgi:hypothetical protein
MACFSLVGLIRPSAACYRTQTWRSARKHGGINELPVPVRVLRS